MKLIKNAHILTMDEGGEIKNGYITVSGGKITGIGTHDELLKSNEEYKEIYYSQMEKEANGNG